MTNVRSVERLRDNAHEPCTRDAELTVYYDGSCSLCSAEIAHYRRLDPSGHLLFKDVSRADVALEPGLDQIALMSRFHVRRADGTLLSGAAAFVGVWSLLPCWRWIAYAAPLPGATLLLEVLYRLFLPVRPAISRLLAAVRAPVRPGVLSGSIVCAVMGISFSALCLDAALFQRRFQTLSREME